MQGLNILCKFCVFLWTMGLVGTANALNSDCEHFWNILSSCNSEVVPSKQKNSQLDTQDDLGGFLGWSADSKFFSERLYYAKSSSEIDIDILNLANPGDFNSAAFTNAEGIWYFPFQVLFENSDDPVVLTTASFNYSGASLSMTNVYVRYYLHGTTNTSFQVCATSGCSEELYNNNELEEWQEVLINLNEMDDEVYENMEDDGEIETTASLVYVEFQTFENNSGYFLVDKIVISTPEPSNSTTTTLGPEVTRTSTIPGETKPTTIKETTTVTTEEPGTVLTTTEGDQQPSSTPGAGTRLKAMTTPNLIVTIVVFIVVHYNPN